MWLILPTDSNFLPDLINSGKYGLRRGVLIIMENTKIQGQNSEIQGWSSGTPSDQSSLEVVLTLLRYFFWERVENLSDPSTASSVSNKRSMFNIV